MTCTIVSTGTTVLVYKPGIAASLVTGNVYDDFAKFATAMAAVNGPVTGFVDDSLATPTVPSGTFNLGTGPLLVGAKKDGTTQLVIAQGGAVTNLPDFQDIQVSHQSTNPLYTIGVGQNLILNLNNATITAVNGAPIQGDPTTSTFVFNMDNGAALVNGGANAVINVSGGDVNLGTLVNIGANTITSTNPITATLLSPSATISSSQSPGPNFSTSNAGIAQLTSDVTAGPVGASSSVAATVVAMSGSGNEVVIKCDELLWQAGQTPHIAYPSGPNLFTITANGGMEIDCASTNGFVVNASAAGCVLNGSNAVDLQVASTSRLSVRSVGVGIGSAPTSGTNVLLIAAGSQPSTSSSNPQLFASSGALKCIGGSGTVTTVAAAHPHCPRCSRDFALEWEQSITHEKFSLCVPCMVQAIEKAGIHRDAFMIENKLHP